MWPGKKQTKNPLEIEYWKKETTNAIICRMHNHPSGNFKRIQCKPSKW